MKARVKSTGEIVEVEKTILKGVECYIQRTEEKIGSIYMEYDLDFGFDCDYISDYWTRLEHTYAGMAMQGMIRTVGHDRMYPPEKIAIYAEACAHALVEKMKNKEEK